MRHDSDAEGRAGSNMIAAADAYGCLQMSQTSASDSAAAGESPAAIASAARLPDR